MASWRGLGSPGEASAGLDPALGLCPAIDAGLKPHLRARGAARCFSSRNAVEQLDRLAPSDGAGLGRGRGLGRPIERAGHLEHQVFAAGKVDERARDLFADGRQVPLELGIGIGRGVLVRSAPEAAGHGPSATRTKKRRPRLS